MELGIPLLFSAWPASDGQYFAHFLTLQLILMPWLCGNLKATDTFCKINKKMSKVNIYNDLHVGGAR